MKKREKISVCKGDVCVHAEGKNANTIATAATFALFAAGVGAIVKLIRS